MSFSSKGFTFFLCHLLVFSIITGREGAVKEETGRKTLKNQALPPGNTGEGPGAFCWFLGRSSVELGQAGEALGQVLVGGDVVAHLAIMELLIGHHVKVAGAGQAKDDGLFLAGLLALEGLVDGGADGVAALGGRQDALSLGWLDFITSLS